MDIYSKIKLSYDEMVRIPNHRYRSWEYCYIAFNNFLNNKTSIDNACLHLAFYLASWGMLRGSSKLLQKDYKVHYNALLSLTKSKYQNLLDFPILDSSKQEDIFDLINSLREELVISYIDTGISCTDTLITKIMLGTYCCAPAYDSYFQIGVRQWNNTIRKSDEQRIVQKFGFNSLRTLIHFYNRNVCDFNTISSYISTKGIYYPPMKLLDMYFWNLAYY